MLLPNRNVSSDDYRYGFNGHEIDPEVYGSGNFMDMGMRCYDARLGRMFMPDPRASEYPWQSTYAYFSNSPISIIDYLGGGGKPTEDGTAEGQSTQTSEMVTTSTSVGTGGVSIVTEEIITNWYWHETGVDEDGKPTGEWQTEDEYVHTLTEHVERTWSAITYEEEYLEGPTGLIKTRTVTELGGTDYSLNIETQAAPELIEAAINSVMLNDMGFGDPFTATITAYDANGVGHEFDNPFFKPLKIQNPQGHGLEPVYPIFEVISFISGAGAAKATFKGLTSAALRKKVATEVGEEVVEQSGKYLVYQGMKNGVVKYVGITSRKASVRWAEHIAEGGVKASLKWTVKKGATGLSKNAARKIEQQLINSYGGAKGGQLINKINSVAPKNWSQFGISP